MEKKNLKEKGKKRIFNDVSKRQHVFIVDKNFESNPVLSKEYIQECVEVSKKLRKDSGKDKQQEITENNTDLTI